MMFIGLFGFHWLNAEADKKIVVMKVKQILIMLKPYRAKKFILGSRTMGNIRENPCFKSIQMFQINKFSFSTL
jgi:hypothetical protein